ncbi:hypothetical protein DUI87_14459 [Hirundo rustica rustica]|uniref:Uncharacterized protein n=1 Tax=Hirundo rustica rustica TaxID=333673 RepID=A0A3M0K555_HIRRU|nr:hypothetical protein DUI87_14459 [Hirundo rustica rustica]
MEAAAGAAAEPAAWAAEPLAEPEPGSEELEAGGALDRVLRESVCQQQGWVRVYVGVKAGLEDKPCWAGKCHFLSIWTMPAVVVFDLIVAFSQDQRIKDTADMKNGKCVWKWMEDYTVEYQELGGDCVYSVPASKAVWEWKSVPSGEKEKCRGICG